MDANRPPTSRRGQRLPAAPAPVAPAPRARLRDRWLATALPTVTLLLTLGLSVSACGEAPPLPALPKSGEGRQWFWRDVLSEPLAGEAPALTELAGLEDPVARLDALADLVARRDPAALPTLMASLRDPDTGVAIAAAQGLGELGDPAALPRLLKGLGPYPIEYDTSIHLRAAEASALAALGSPAGIPLALMLLEEDTDDEAPRVAITWDETQQMVFLRELALPALRSLAGTDFGYVPNGSVPARQAAARAARQWWEQHRTRLWADSPAGRPGDASGLSLRLRLMVAHLGAYQLRQIDGARYTLTHVGPAVLPYLQDGLKSADTLVRVHSLEVMRDVAALADVKGHTRLAIVAAGPLLEDPQIPVATAAAAVCAAARIADPLVTALARRSEPEVQLAVIDALGATGQPVARQVLEEFAASHAGVLEGAPDLGAALDAALLALDPERSPEALLARLADRDPDRVYPALERLILLTGSDHGVDPLAPPAARTANLEAARAALESRGD